MGLRYDLASLDRRVQDDASSPADDPVRLHRAALTGALRLPGDWSVALQLPVGLVAGGEGTTTGEGDLALWLGQGLGTDLRLQLDAGLTAPTGRYDARSVLSEVDLQGLDDGSFLIATYDTRASLGAGSWSARARSLVRAPLGPVALRGHGALAQPLNRTPDGYRWGRDVAAGGAFEGPALGPVTLDVGLERRWHQTDRFAFVDAETGEPMEQPVGRRAATVASAGVGLRLGDRVACRVDGQRVVAQRADGIQLLASGGVGAGCTLRATRRP